MPTSTAKKTDVNTYELSFLIDRKSYDEETDRAFRKNASRLNIPGFRRGKAPRSIVEKMYGKDVFANEVIDALLPAAYQNAIEENGLEPVDRPEVDVDSIDEEGVHLKATVTVKPDVELSDYLGLSVTKPGSEVKDEEINDKLEEARKRNSRLLEIDEEPAKDGDEVLIDYTGYLGEEKFEGGSGTDYTLPLGSNSFIPGFEEQVVGHKKGEEFDIFVTFPQDYHAEELAGKEAKFHIALHKISRRILPDLDDEFVKDVSEWNTLDEYKKDIAAQIADRKEKDAERQVRTQIADQLIEKMNADIPKCMIDREAEAQFNDFVYRLQSQGLSWEMYSQYVGKDKNAVIEDFRAGAERSVKRTLALEKVAKDEKLEVTAEELESKYSEIAGLYGAEVDYVKKNISEDGLKEEILQDKAMDFLVAHAKISKKAETKKPAKKASKPKAEDTAEDESKKEASKKAAPKKAAPKKAAPKAEDAPENEPKPKKTTRAKAKDAKTEE